jgi:hypothetical protein
MLRVYLLKARKFNDIGQSGSDNQRAHLNSEGCRKWRVTAFLRTGTYPVNVALFDSAISLRSSALDIIVATVS